jgi:hypothetical protein
MSKPASTVLSAAARLARKQGLSAQEAIKIVAQVYGGCVGKHGEITGWCKPDEERPVRRVRVRKSKQDQEVKNEE